MAKRIVSFLFVYAKLSSADVPEHLADALEGLVHPAAVKARTVLTHRTEEEVEALGKDPKVQAARKALIQDQKDFGKIVNEELDSRNMKGALKGLGKGLKNLDIQSEIADNDPRMRALDKETGKGMKKVVAGGVAQVGALHPNFNKALKGVGKGLKQAVAVGKGLMKDPNVEAFKNANDKKYELAYKVDRALTYNDDLRKPFLDARKSELELKAALEDAASRNQNIEDAAHIVEGLVHSAVDPPTAPTPEELVKEARAMAKNEKLVKAFEVAKATAMKDKILKEKVLETPEGQAYQNQIKTVIVDAERAADAIPKKPEVINAAKGLGKGLKELGKEIDSAQRDPRVQAVGKGVSEKVANMEIAAIKKAMEMQPGFKDAMVSVGKGIDSVKAAAKEALQKPEVQQALQDIKNSRSRVESAEADVQKQLQSRTFGPREMATVVESEKEPTASSGSFVLVFVCVGVSGLAAYHFGKRRAPVLDQPLLG